MSTSSLPIMSNLPGAVPYMDYIIGTLSQNGKWTQWNRIFTIYTGIATLLNYVDTNGEEWKLPFNHKFNDFLDILKKTSTLLPFSELLASQAPVFQCWALISSYMKRKWKIFDASWKFETLETVIVATFIGIVIEGHIVGIKYVIPRINEYYLHPDLVELSQSALDHLPSEAIGVPGIAERSGVTKFTVSRSPDELMEQTLLLISMAFTIFTLFANFSYLKVSNLVLQAISLINIAKRHILDATTTWSNLVIPVREGTHGKITHIRVEKVIGIRVQQSIQFHRMSKGTESSIGARTLSIYELKKQILRNLPAQIERGPISIHTKTFTSMMTDAATLKKLLPWACDSNGNYKPSNGRMFAIVENEATVTDRPLYITGIPGF